MKLFFRAVIFGAFLCGSTMYGQEIVTENEQTVITAHEIAKQKEVKEKVEAAAKKAKKAEKEIQKAEKEAKRKQKLTNAISAKNKAIAKKEKQITKFQNKLVKGKSKGTLSPVAIAKINSKIDKANQFVATNKAKLARLLKK